jgi:undecaprenyl-diphosphatase
MTTFEALILGVVQGLTEFLPISSTAHLVVVRYFMGHQQPEDAFTTVIQLGTLLAVLWYFRADVVALTRAVLADLRARRLASSPESRLAWLIALGTVPAVLVGGLFKHWLKEHFFNVPSLAIVSIVFALLMALAEVWHRLRQTRGSPDREVADVNWRTALWVGAWQALALMPGGSRSGTTITAGLFAGLSRSAAARFSFLLSLPIVFAAGMKELYDEYKKLAVPDGPPSLFASGDELVNLAVGLVVSAVVGYLSIAWLLGYLRSHTTGVFIVYRIVLGVTLLVLLACGMLVP